MPSRLPLAPLLGALIRLTRHEPGAAESQGALLRAIRTLFGDQPLRIRAEPDALHFDDENISLRMPGAIVLNEHLLLHALASVELEPTIAEADLQRLAVALAAFPGAFASHEELVEALGVSAQRIKLTPAANSLGVYPLASRPRLEQTPPDDSLGIQHQDAEMVNLGPADPDDLVLLRDGVATPTRPTLGSILARGREALSREDWNGVVDAAIALTAEEDESPSERTGQVYRQELRRLIRPDQLEHVARLVHGERKQEVIGVLRRFGGAATEVLVELLVGSPYLDERRSYYTAITQMRAGAEAILARLDHPLWYVVRNAAELCGELEITDAVPALGRQMQHPDERVRKSVAGALARIGTPLAMQWLRKMLSDPAPLVCRQALKALRGPAARELCPAIGELLERETTADVQREALQALGRIGSEQALDILTGWAAPTSKRYGRNPVALRLQAVQAIALGGPEGGAALSALSRDDNPEVSAAATVALESFRV